MAYAEYKFRSHWLCRQVSFYLILPNDAEPQFRKGNPHYEREPKTLLLLGGYGNAELSWIYGTSIMDLALKYNLAVILPAGENSFYVDGKGKGRAYGRYIGEELVSYVQQMFSLPEGRENTFIGGVSMGGFGAIHGGLTYPEVFGKIVGFSSALVIHDIAGQKPGYEDGIGDYEYYNGIFGDLAEVEESSNNPQMLVKCLQEQKQQLPGIYLACGTEDPFLNNNREFYEFLQKENISAAYHEIEGGHDWHFWNQCLEDAVLWMLAESDNLEVRTPPASQTEDSIAVIWDKPENWREITEYRIYLNGIFHGTASGADYTAEGLEPETIYQVTVYPVIANQEIKYQGNTAEAATKPLSKRSYVTDSGAKGDGITLNTESIQKAIDACEMGGTVVIPAGIFLSGAIFLKSHMTLYLEKGAVLLGSSELNEYPLMSYGFEGRNTKLSYASLVNTMDIVEDQRLQEITIAGPGTIDASGSILRQKELLHPEYNPGRGICIRNTDRIYLKDITVRQSPAWCVHMMYCNEISLNNVEIHTKYDENGNRYNGIANGDGFDPDSCKNVFVFHSLIASQDDCIAIKSGRDEEGRRIGIASENIRVTDCTFLSGFGVVVGSEMSGCVRNVLVRDCTFHNVYSVGSIKTPRGRGGVAENIRYEDLTLLNEDLSLKDCEWFRGAIYIDQFYSHVTFDRKKEETVNEGTPVIRNVVFSNITVDTYTGNAIYLVGLPESPLQNIRLENISAKGKYGMKAANIQGLKLNGVKIESREDDDILLDGISGLVFSDNIKKHTETVYCPV